MKKPTLYIFAGLPGAGKSTLAIELAKKENIVFIRIDTVEQGLRDLCQFNVQGEGYRLSYRIANLKLPTWEEVINRDYHPWKRSRIVIDTAGKSVGESLEDLISALVGVI